jgi:hypothetical protein
VPHSDARAREGEAQSFAHALLTVCSHVDTFVVLQGQLDAMELDKAQTEMSCDRRTRHHFIKPIKF